MSQPAPACREPAILTLTAYNTEPACVLYRSHAAYSTSISQKRTWRARLRAAIVLHSINRKMDDQKSCKIKTETAAKTTQKTCNILSLAEKLKINEELEVSKGQNFAEMARKHGVSSSTISKIKM